MITNLSVVTCAFEFEDEPYFDGFRTSSTNGIAQSVPCKIIARPCYAEKL